MRVVPTAAVVLAASFAFAAPALGHAELVPHQLPPGAAARLLVLVTHGCGGEEEWISTEPLEEEPMIALTVQAPLELDITPNELEGWTVSSETDEAGRVISARWDSDDPAGTTDTLQFPLDVTVADVPDGSEIWLPVVQECTQGESLEWTLEGDIRGGDAVPALRLLVREGASVPPTGRGAEASSGTTRVVVPSIVLALLGTAGLVHTVRRRRATSRATD